MNKIAIAERNYYPIAVLKGTHIIELEERNRKLHF